VDRLPERDTRTPPFDFARTLLASDPSPERMFEMAMEYLDRGEADVALLLLEQAEAQAYAPAILAIGRLYDPVHFDPRDSPFTHANPDRALDYYRRALDAGDEEARAAIDRLESWAEEAAAEGDPEAEALLERLNP
jgi:TPR repeat protein